MFCAGSRRSLSPLATSPNVSLQGTPRRGTSLGIGGISAPPLLLPCSICEQPFHADILEEHSELCATLKKLLKGLVVDAALTTVSNFVEEQVWIRVLWV
jgi:hypothetical protein